jgi:hypothetical protein
VPLGPPTQQPLGHEVASQTHADSLHSWPDGHATHAFPPIPHDVLVSLVGCSHLKVEPLLAQHPGHDLPAHVHEPSEHASPFTHAPQAPPPVPHAPVDCLSNARHCCFAPLPLQHPFVHDVASQAHSPVVVLHARPAPHASHAAPPTPQTALVSEASATHRPAPSQHPPGHDVGPQVEAPSDPSPSRSGLLRSVGASSGPSGTV